MFSHLNLEEELHRVNSIQLPTACCISFKEEDFCKHYLYDLVVKRYGVFREAPIFHLPHNNLPLLESLWPAEFEYFYLENRACVYVLTDDNFEFPDPLWRPLGRRYGPVFADSRLIFHGQRYMYNAAMRCRRLLVDVFTASPRRRRDADQFDFRFRALKIHNPDRYDYRIQSRYILPRRGLYDYFTGPYGDAPHPFQP